MTCLMVPFPVILSDHFRLFQGHGYALDELCAQLTRYLFAIAKFLLPAVLLSARQEVGKFNAVRAVRSCIFAYVLVSWH